MNPAFSFTPEQTALRDTVVRLCREFPPAYWRAHDESGAFPEDFRQRIAAAGLLGVAMPETFGGAGLGITEAALILGAVAESGAGMSGASAVHMNVFGLHPVTMFGTEAQKRRMLPPVIAGEHIACFAVTEPDSGLDTSRISTTARRDGDTYIVDGRKIWTSTAQVASHLLLLARTSPRSEAKPLDGLTLFYTPLDRSKIEVRDIPKMGRAAVDSNMLFIDGLCIPDGDRIGAEGEGFRCLLHGLNPERILIAAEAVGLGRAALARAASYARERHVFGAPIGRYQGVQHPLAERWMELEAAQLMWRKAAALYDSGEPCGAEANAAKFLAAEAGFRACETAVLTLGGMGYAKEYDVERLFRESMIARLAPVSRQMILNFVAEKALGLPKSY